jgi:hypothetical protein
MKRIFFMSFVVTAMIFLGANMKSSARININLAKNTPAFISYQVNIHPDNLLLGNSCSTRVEITNGSGMVIGQPQLYMAGVYTYYFYELGPVTGIRKAIISNEIGNRNIEPCISLNWWQTRSSTFKNGENYIFNLSAPSLIQPGNTVADE